MPGKFQIERVNICGTKYGVPGVFPIAKYLFWINPDKTETNGGGMDFCLIPFSGILSRTNYTFDSGSLPEF